jgi:uncharacterized protein
MALALTDNPQISHLSDRFVKNPFEVISVGDVVKVKVIRVDKERGWIGLSIKMLAHV